MTSGKRTSHGTDGTRCAHTRGKPVASERIAGRKSRETVYEDGDTGEEARQRLAAKPARRGAAQSQTRLD